MEEENKALELPNPNEILSNSDDHEEENKDEDVQEEVIDENVSKIESFSIKAALETEEKLQQLTEQVLLTSLVGDQARIPPEKLEKCEEEEKHEAAEEISPEIQEEKDKEESCENDLLENDKNEQTNEITFNQTDEEAMNELIGDLKDDDDAQLKIDIKEEIPITPKEKKKKESQNPILTEAFSPKKPKMPSYIEDPPPLLHSDEELEAELNKTIKKKVAPPIELCREVIIYAKEKNMEAIDSEDYDRAAQIDEAIRIIQIAISSDKSSYDNSQQAQNIRNRLDSVQNRQAAIEEQYKHRIEAQKEDEQRRMEAVENEHIRQLEEFEAQWSSPEAMQPYTKPSNLLLQLRRQQRQLALAHEFEQAKALKARADQVQAAETAEARRRAAEAMKQHYATLIDRHRREIECLTLNSERKLKLLESERDRELLAAENTAKSLKSRISSPKSKPVVTVPQVDSRMHGARTRAQRSRLSKQAEPAKLDVKIGDFKAIVKPKTGTPRSRK